MLGEKIELRVSREEKLGALLVDKEAKEKRAPYSGGSSEKRLKVSAAIVDEGKYVMETGQI